MRGVSLRTIAGVLVLAFGVAAIFVDGVASLVPFSPTLVDAVGVLLVGAALWMGRVALNTSRTSATPPVVETPTALAVPGDEFDGKLDELDSSAVRARDHERWLEVDAEVRRRLRSVAVATLVSRYDMTEREAETALAEGTWTDDPTARDYFSEASEDRGSFGTQLRSVTLFGRASQQSGPECVIAELDAIASGQREQPGLDTQREGQA